MPPLLRVIDDRPAAADRVPVLTEVVELSPAGAAPTDAAPGAVRDAPALADGPPVGSEEAVAAPAAAPPAAAEPPPLPDASALVDEVLAALAPRLDALFEDRVRAALAPAIARAAEGLIRDARQELAATLCDVVEEAVHRTLRRHEDRAADPQREGG